MQNSRMKLISITPARSVYLALISGIKWCIVSRNPHVDMFTLGVQRWGSQHDSHGWVKVPLVKLLRNCSLSLCHLLALVMLSEGQTALISLQCKADKVQQIPKAWYHHMALQIFTPGNPATSSINDVYVSSKISQNKRSRLYQWHHSAQHKRKVSSETDLQSSSKESYTTM